MRALVLLFLAGCGLGTNVPTHDPVLASNTPATLALALAINSAAPDELVDIQLSIVREAAPAGPVIVFAPNDEERVALEQRLSAEPQLSRPLVTGMLRVLTARFEGPWIRDYGPLSGAKGFIDASYNVDEKTNELEQRRARLYEKVRIILQESENENSSVLNDTLQKVELIDKLIGSRSRPLDDDAPLSMLDAIYAARGFGFQQVNLQLEGGNLLRLANGTCLTTTDTIEKNHGQRDRVEAELRRVGLCRKVLFLVPLPGQGIIKHVDMFVLPALNDNKVFLADYSDVVKRMHTTTKDTDDDQDSDETDETNSTLLESLNTDAMLAMNHDADLLAANGISVTRVPALGAATSMQGLYFPTTLNGVYAGTAGHHVLLLPKYDGANRDIQDNGLQAIRGELKNVNVVEIEATAAATAQGALHCLTLEVPVMSDMLWNPDRLTNMQPTYQRRAVYEQVKADEQFTHLRGKWDGPDNMALEVTGTELIFTWPGDSYRLKIRRSGRLLTKQPVSVRIVDVTEHLAMLEIDGQPRVFRRRGSNDTL